MNLKHTLLAAATATMMLSTLTGAVIAAQPGTPAFKGAWERTDRPVAEGAVSRTWMWGPEASTVVLWEDYTEAPGGKRQVQYFDKSRMEITNPGGDQSSPWHVTNGLLVVEMATGNLQTGEARFEQRLPATIPVAGDATNNSAPTYATIGAVTDRHALPAGETIVQRLTGDGTVASDPALAALGVKAGHYVPETKHTVADVFWTFMRSTGPVYESGKLAQRDLFQNPFYATGLPITEAYWTLASVGGGERDVLLQCFERRCMTYTPGNPDGWKVESGNVGLHYYHWRYGASPTRPTENSVVASIPTGPDTLEYRFKGNPPSEALDDGPSAIAVAPDGTFWIADSYGARVARFDRDGKRIGTIELEEQGVQSISDVQVRGNVVWVSWSNVFFELYKLQAYAFDGTSIGDYDLPESVWNDHSYLTHGMAFNDDGELIFVLDLGIRYLRVLDSNGAISVAEVSSLRLGGHTFAKRSIDMTHMAIEVDGRAVTVIANEDVDAFAQSVGLVTEPAQGRFFVWHTLVFDTVGRPFEHYAYEFGIDGVLLGTTVVPLDEMYTYVQHRHAVGPDGNAYMLATHQDRLEIVQLGFSPSR